MFKWETKKVYNALIQLGDADDSGKGKHFKSRFFKDGLVKVEPFGTVFIKKENLDKYINTMVGVPVIINHKDLTDENVNDERVGVVNSVWYNEEDGWYWCDGIIWDETAQNLITDKGWSVSCSYDVKVANDEGGSENNIKYDIEFLDAVFTHLALVNNPRYERANIVFNSKTVIENGGQGSGNFGHAGRIGEVGGSSTNAPQNVDINTLKPVEYTEDDVKRFEQDGSIKEFYKSYIQKGTVTHPELGEIKLVEKGLTETINKNRHRNMYLLGKIPQLIESAQYDRPEELTHPREDGINKFHYLYAKAQRGTKSKIVLIKIAEDNQGNKFFILKPVQTIKNSSESLSQLSHNGSQGASETIFIINNISEDFNPNVKESEQMEIENEKNEIKNNIDNSKEQEMELIEKLKALIFSVENEKEYQMEVNNEKVDKRDIIRQIMAIAGKEEASEDVKTIAKLAEKLAYDKSEADSADNKKECKNEKEEDKKDEKVDNKCDVKNEDEKDEKEVKEVKEEVKEDVENKCKNSVDNSKPDYFNKLSEIYNSVSSNIKSEPDYVSRADREKAADDYFRN